MRLVALLLLASATAHATPIRAGANHHLGDDSWRFEHGKRPTPADDEHDRMHVHLQYVRELLGHRPATRPELAERRAELLGYLDDYIRLGITPRNDYVPWRNPVFIDRGDRICAVGYLIERSVGRALPEAIAAAHRLDYLEDIAVAMPEVAAWVETSGFTLEELASIQPGYMGPEVQFLAGWSRGKADEDDSWVYQPPQKLVDGAYSTSTDGVTLTGTVTRKQMTGTWTRMLDGTTKVLGTGTFKAGNGTWKSMRPDGSKMAEGPYVASHAHGTWTFFHPSGRLAAKGAIVRGKRDGSWTFFYDDRGSPRLAVVDFKMGFTLGGRHYDRAGKLIATGAGAGMGLRLRTTPDKKGITHELHQGIPAESYRLDGFYQGGDRIYVRSGYDLSAIYDAGAHHLEKDGATWRSTACKWPRKMRDAAGAGDIATLHAEILRGAGDDTSDPMACTGAITTLSPARSAKLDAMLASRLERRAPLVPAFDFPLVSNAKRTEPEAEREEEKGQLVEGPKDDLVTYLGDHMQWYIEWPHVDDTFFAVYRSLPGYAPLPDPVEGE